MWEDGTQTSRREGAVQFRDLLSILRARWRTIVACVLLALSAAAAMTLLAKPVYEARTRIFLAATIGGFVISSNDLGTYVELIGSPVLQDPLRERLGLPPGSPLGLSATVSEGAPIMEVTCVHESGARAAQIANAVGPQLAEIGGKYLPLLAAAGGKVEATSLAPATVPARPVSPDLIRNLAVGGLGGLALGLGVVLLWHFADTKVRGTAEVRAISARPILGYLRRVSNAANRIVMETDPHSVAAEEFRRLRTNLQFVDVTTGHRHSFGITSPMAGEGKTTTAINLALAVADAGNRVLLVDADLRHPSVAKALGLEGGVGLTTLLLSRAKPEDVIQRWGDTQMWVLAAGELPPNPSELLDSEDMATLFETLVSGYDMVIVDCPPVIPVIDPVVVGKLVGGLVIVTSVGQTTRRDLTMAVRHLEQVDVKIAGFALNNIEGGGSYYQYGYHSPSGSRAKPVRARLATKKGDEKPADAPKPVAAAAK